MDKYVYNLENKMVQVFQSFDGGTYSRISDAFYHLDGSRMWEGIFHEYPEWDNIEGQFQLNPYYHLRINAHDNSYYIYYIFANGRRIAAIQKLITDTQTFGCQLTFAPIFSTKSTNGTKIKKENFLVRVF